LIPKTRDVVIFYTYQILVIQVPAYDILYFSVTKKLHFWKQRVIGSHGDPVRDLERKISFS